MKVDIIICTYNRAEKLRETIKSIQNVTIPEDVDIKLIVVDNNSADHTEKVIKEFSQYAENIKIRYLFAKAQGKSRALNYALKHITGNLIAFTDDDIIVDKGWVNEMVNASERYSEYNCFGGKIVAVYPENLPEWLDIHGSMKFLRSVFADREDGDLELEYGSNTFSKTPGGGNMAFRRDAIEKNGFFRTDLGHVGKERGFSEDTEYCQRMLQKGEKFMYIPSAIVYHNVQKGHLNKEYLLNWQYKCGRSEVRRDGGYVNVRKIFGVPMYLINNAIRHTAGCVLPQSQKKRIYHKLRLYYTVGEIVEHVSIKFKKT